MMSEEDLLGETSYKSMLYQREVIDAFEIHISRSNDPSVSKSDRTACREWVDRWSPVRVMDILQCRHFSTNDLAYPFLHKFSNQQFSWNKPLAVYQEEVPTSGPEGFTLPNDDNALLHIIPYLDYFTAHKMTLVSKRFKKIMNTFKSMRSKEMLASMPFILDEMEEGDFRRGPDIPELIFWKIWHPKYDPLHRKILRGDAMKFADEKNFFEFYDGSNTPQERLSVLLRLLHAQKCMDIHDSFTLSDIEDAILQNDLHAKDYISLDKPQVSEHGGYECEPYIRFKILSRHQVTLQEAWKIFVERIIVNSDENKHSRRDMSRRYSLWSLLAAADPSSIHLSHVHAGCSSRFFIHVYDQIALSFVIGGEKVEVVGRMEQFGEC